MNSPRTWNALRSLRLSCCVAMTLLCGAIPALAGSITCGTPTSGGIVSIRIKVGRNTVCGDEINISIPAPPKPPVGGLDTLKAETILKAITSKCSEVTATRAVGSNQVVVTSSGGNVTVTELSNSTGETDQWAMAWPDTRSQLCTLGGSAGGLSFDGVQAGHVTVGTAAYVATVPTSRGESSVAVLSAALAQLNAHGVANVSLVSLGTNQAGLLFHLTTEPYLTWGCDDGNLLSQCLMLQDSTELGNGSENGEFFVTPGTPGVTLQLDAAPNHAHTEATLYGYDPTQQAWIERGSWSVGSASAQIQIATSPQIVHYQLRCEGDHSPITGMIIDANAPTAQTPNTPLFVPGVSVGFADGSAAEFNPTLGQGGGTIAPITIQPGLSLNTVPALVGAGHCDYIPLQFNVQPDPSRPWLYLGNDPAQGFAEHTTLDLHLSGLFDPFGNPVLQLPIVIGLVQGATQWSTTVNATQDPSGAITIPPLDLGSLLAQPFSLMIGVGPGSGAQATVRPATIAAGAAGFVAIDGIELTSAPSSTAGVDGHFDHAEQVRFAAPWPNPCLSDARLHFGIERSGPVSLQILDAAGRVVRTVANTTMAAGAHDLRWDARDDSARRVAEGIYFARLSADGTTQSRKITVLR